MAAVEVTISGMLYDKLNRTMQNVVLIGEATLTGLGVGGGPIIPPEGEKPPRPPLGIWGGPIDPYPDHGLPQPPGGGQPPTGEPDDDGFVKPPPEAGGWAYHKDYGWGYYPGPGQAGPKR